MLMKSEGKEVKKKVNRQKKEYKTKTMINFYTLSRKSK